MERGGRDVAPLTQGTVASMLDNSARTANLRAVMHVNQLPFWHRVIKACFTRLCLKGSLCKITPSGQGTTMIGTWRA
ncbi:MAG: hypothetical protein APF81_07700 [Desulfosporosinus sp. BRH_c37]|nr:MAG: hypothetical protein APF81_07700 [Desulfosporosinus sp. BRH_c37]